MKSCIVKAHQAGMFSLLNNVITSLDKYDYVSVDWTGSIYSGGDLWPVLFKKWSDEMWGYGQGPAPKIIPGGVILPPDCSAPELITGYQDQWLTYKNAGQLYLSKYPDCWRERCHRLWKKLTVQPQILANVARFPMLNQFRGKTVAALIRAHGHAGEQLSGKSQTLEQYIEAIEAENPDHIYIASQDTETQVQMHKHFYQPRYDTHCHPYAKRSPSRDIDRHLVEPQTHRDAIVVLEEAMIMSQCDVLIHPISNISTAVLYMNPKIKSVFLQ